MNRILEYCNTITDETLRRELAENYLNRVKQLVGQSNDFAKGLWFWQSRENKDLILLREWIEPQI